ncbi:hypothetical protein M434DRAFT_67822 [Hypoxylon sp. CO27-5]|nr:hypothetical protein M434DRAFT_67822 [Hypoxylon sp. CO27-5]
MAHEKTFLAYTKAQGETYAADRPRYSPELFRIIIDHHTSTGGQLNTVLDVGCGTGQATRDLASYFSNAIGLDPSEGMISTARSPSKLVTSPIRFEVSAAEVLGADLEPPITDGSVDLLTAATAAHWFEMERFWSSAARVLKPGGTVALWARTWMSVDPIMTPNGPAVKAAVDETLSELEPYMNLGNKLSRDLYVDLPLPWTLEVPVEGFDKMSFIRKEWDNRVNSAESDNTGLGIGRTVTFGDIVRVLGTGSPVTRWRERHPDKADTEEDIVTKMSMRVQNLLHDVDVKPGKFLSHLSCINFLPGL